MDENSPSGRLAAGQATELAVSLLGALGSEGLGVPGGSWGLSAEHPLSHRAAWICAWAEAPAERGGDVGGRAWRAQD